MRRLLSCFALLAVLSTLPGLQSAAAQEPPRLTEGLSGDPSQSRARVDSVDPFEPDGGWALINAKTQEQELLFYGSADWTHDALARLQRPVPVQHAAGTAVVPVYISQLLEQQEDKHETTITGDVGRSNEAKHVPVGVSDPNLFDPAGGWAILDPYNPAQELIHYTAVDSANNQLVGVYRPAPVLHESGATIAAIWLPVREPRPARGADRAEPSPANESDATATPSQNRSRHREKPGEALPRRRNDGRPQPANQGPQRPRQDSRWRGGFFGGFPWLDEAVMTQPGGGQLGWEDFLPSSRTRSIVEVIESPEPSPSPTSEASASPTPTATASGSVEAVEPASPQLTTSMPCTEDAVACAEGLLSLLDELCPGYQCASEWTDAALQATQNLLDTVDQLCPGLECTAEYVDAALAWAEVVLSLCPDLQCAQGVVATVTALIDDAGQVLDDAGAWVDYAMGIYADVMSRCPQLQCAEEHLTTLNNLVATVQGVVADACPDLQCTQQWVDAAMGLYAQLISQCPNLECTAQYMTLINNLVATVQDAVADACPGGVDACIQPWVDKVMALYAEVLQACPDLECAQQVLTLVNNLVATVQNAVADACPGGVDACIQPWVDKVMALYAEVLQTCPDLECAQQVMVLVDNLVDTVRAAITNLCPAGVGSCVDEKVAIVGSLIAATCPNLDCTDTHLDFIELLIQETADDVCPAGTGECLRERTDYLAGLAETVVAVLADSCPELQCADPQIDDAIEIINGVIASACPDGTAACADERVDVILALLERGCPSLQCAPAVSDLLARLVAAACDGESATCVRERVDTIVEIAEQNCPNLGCAANIVAWAEELLARLCSGDSCLAAIGPLVDDLLTAGCANQDSSACLTNLREEFLAAIESLMAASCPDGLASDSPEGAICGNVQPPTVECPNGITACAMPTPYVPGEMPDADLQPVPGVTPRVPNIPATPTPQQDVVEVDPTVMPDLPEGDVAAQQPMQSSSSEPSYAVNAPVPEASSYCANGQAKAIIYWHGYSSGRGSQGYIVDIDRSDDGWGGDAHWNKWFDWPQGDYPNSATSDIEGFQGVNGRPTPLQLEEGRQYKVRVYYRATHERTYDGYFMAATGCGSQSPGQAPGIETPQVETYCADGKPQAYISWHGYGSHRGAYGYIVDVDYAWETWDGDQHWSKWFDGPDGDYSNSARTSTVGFFGNNGRPTPMVLYEGFNYKVRVFYRKSGERSADRYFTAPSGCTPPPPPALEAPSVTTYCDNGGSKANFSWESHVGGRGDGGYIVDVDYAADGWDEGSHWNKRVPAPQYGESSASTSSEAFEGQNGRATPMVLEGGRSYKVRVYFWNTGERTPDATFTAQDGCAAPPPTTDAIASPSVQPYCSDGLPAATFYWHGYASGRGKTGYILDVDYADDPWPGDSHWSKWFSTSQGDSSGSATSEADGFQGHGGRPTPMVLDAGRTYKMRVYYRHTEERSADATFTTPADCSWSEGTERQIAPDRLDDLPPLLVVAANVRQFYPNPPEEVRKETRADAFARRLQILGSRARNRPRPNNDGMEGLPGVILLQETAWGGAKRIRDALKDVGYTYRIVGDGANIQNSYDYWNDPARHEGTGASRKDPEFETAILYNPYSLTLKSFKHVAAHYDDGRECSSAELAELEYASVFDPEFDSDQNGIFDCYQGRQIKRQLLALFERKDAAGAALTGYTVAVASVHFPTTGHFAERSETTADNNKARWVQEIDNELSGWGGGVHDVHVIGGDFNAHRCLNKKTPSSRTDYEAAYDYAGSFCSARAWWSKADVLGYHDAIVETYRSDAHPDPSLHDQYRDGLQSSGEPHYRTQRIDYLFSRSAGSSNPNSSLRGASHDLTCGQYVATAAKPNCDLWPDTAPNRARYSDHRLLWMRVQRA